MTKENTLGAERPKCDNPKCDKGAQVMIGIKMFCGGCTTKILQAKSKEDSEKLMGYLK